MSAALFALVERLHGHLALLSLALLLHPVVTMKYRRRLTPWARRSAALATAMLAVTFATGWGLYPHYRSHIKPGLLERLPPVAMRFETKEHLSVLALALAVGGALALWYATDRSRELAWRLLLLGWICGAATAGLGVFVASLAHPGW